MTDGLPTPRRYFATFSLCVGAVVLVTDSTIASVALPTIAHDLKVQPSEAVFILTIYQLVLAMTIMAFSALGDRIGQRRLYRSGLLVFALTAPLCFFATSLPALLAIRAVQALSAAAALSVTFGMVRNIYPITQLGRGLGINTLASALGGALAPVIGGFILSVASWRWVFFAGAPLALLTVLAGKALPDSHAADHRFDVKGAALCAVTFGSIIFGLDSLIHNISVPLSICLLLVGVITGFIFVRHELGHKNPVLPIDLLGRPSVSLPLIASCAAVVGSSCVLFSLPFRLQHEYGFGAGQIGAVIAPYAAATVIFAPGAGMLSDRVSTKLLGAVGLCAALASLLLIAFLPAKVTMVDMAWRLALCGAGFSTFGSSNARTILAVIEPHRSAAGGGLMSSTRQFSQALGATLLAALLASGTASGPIPALVGIGFALLAFACGGFWPARAAAN